MVYSLRPETILATDPAYTWDVFIAHAGKDASTAEQLYDMLHQKCRVFLDSRCLELGDNWDLKLPAAQEASFLTVVLISSNTEKAYYQREEIAAAIDLARDDEDKYRVIPIYLDQQGSKSKKVHYGLRLKHGLTVSEDLSLAQCADRLLDTLNRLKPGKATGSAGAAVAFPQHDQRGILHQPPANWSSPVLHNPWRYKVAAFDFDGTLLRGKDFEFSWEAVWKGLGFSTNIQKQLKREYRKKSEADPSRSARVAAYQAWCEKACDHFKSRGLTRNQLKEFAQPLELTKNCREALAELRAKGLAVAIISGGINTFLEDTFPDFRDFVDFAFINELLFADTGKLTGVRASSYDFYGKPEALDVVCERVGCNTDETMFVGDHFNDEAIMLKVDKAIAYPPRDVVAKNAAQIPIDEDNLLAILPYILVN